MRRVEPWAATRPEDVLLAGQQAPRPTRHRDGNDRARAGELSNDPAEGTVLVGTPDTTEAPTRPAIVLGPDLARVVDETIAALARLDVYQRGGTLVDVVRDATTGAIIRPEGTPRIRLLPAPRLRELSTLAADFKRRKRTDEGIVLVSVQPPGDVLAAVAARGEWSHVRPLSGIADHPVLRPDGSILSVPGYDPATGLLCEPTVTADISEHPTRDDAAAAIADLLDLVCDFPFAGDEHRAAWLAAALTIVARPAIDGPVPLTLFDANELGSGKTLLADVIARIVRGRSFARRTVPEESAEWKKALLGIAIAADPVVLLDNVKRMISSDALEAVLTGEGFKERILGRNEELELPIRTVFFATANNATLSADLVRRSLHIRLEAGENPAVRTGFKYPDLKGHIQANRARYLGALLTILRAYVVAGRPSVPLRPMGSYDAWSAVVRASLVWAGATDPATSQDGLRESSDPERTELGAVLRCWRALYQDRAVAVAVVLADLGQAGTGPRERALADALATWVDGDAGRLQAASRKIGNRLRVNRGRIIDGLCIAKGPDDSHVGQRWSVRDTRAGQGTPNPPGDSGDSGESETNPKREREREVYMVETESPEAPESHDDEPGFFDDLLHKGGQK